MKEFTFQFHVTMSDFSVKEKETFVKICEKEEIKPLLIKLPQGIYLKQPMYTKLIKQKSLENSILEIEKTNSIFKLNNFYPIRIKSEVNAEDSDYFNKTYLPNFTPYYEWHCKILAENISLITNICKKYDGHLSENSLEENQNKKFITVREYGAKENFYKNVSKMYNTLIEHNIKIFKQKFEYCIYDTKIDLDKGWA